MTGWWVLKKKSNAVTPLWWYLKKINSRCALKHDRMLTNTNRACQCDGPPGSTGQCFTAELWEPVKWGAFNVISARLIWPQCLRETPAGVRFELIEKSRQHVCRPTVTWRKHPLASSHFPLRSSITEMQSINHREYYGDHCVLWMKLWEEMPAAMWVVRHLNTFGYQMLIQHANNNANFWYVLIKIQEIMCNECKHYRLT